MQITSQTYHIPKQNKPVGFVDKYLIIVILPEYHYSYTHHQKINVSDFVWTLKICALYECWSRGNFGSCSAVVKEILHTESHSWSCAALCSHTWVWGKEWLLSCSIFLNNKEKRGEINTEANCAWRVISSKRGTVHASCKLKYLWKSFISHSHSPHWNQWKLPPWTDIGETWYWTCWKRQQLRV